MLIAMPWIFACVAVAPGRSGALVRRQREGGQPVDFRESYGNAATADTTARPLSGFSGAV